MSHSQRLSVVSASDFPLRRGKNSVASGIRDPARFVRIDREILELDSRPSCREIETNSYQFMLESSVTMSNLVWFVSIAAMSTVGLVWSATSSQVTGTAPSCCAAGACDCSSSSDCTCRGDCECPACLLKASPAVGTAVATVAAGKNVSCAADGCCLHAARGKKTVDATGLIALAVSSTASAGSLAVDATAPMNLSNRCVCTADCQCCETDVCSCEACECPNCLSL